MKTKKKHHPRKQIHSFEELRTSIENNFWNLMEKLKQKYRTPWYPFEPKIDIYEDNGEPYIIITAQWFWTKQNANPNFINKGYRPITVEDIKEIIKTLTKFIDKHGKGKLRVGWFQAQEEGWLDLLKKMGFVRTMIDTGPFVVKFINTKPHTGTTPL